MPVVQFVANAVTAVVSVPVSAGLCALQVLAALAQWAVVAQFQLAAQIIASLSYGEVSELATSLLNPDGRIGIGSVLGLTPAVSAALLPSGLTPALAPMGLTPAGAVIGLPINADELGRIATTSVEYALSLPLVQSVTPTALSVMGRSFLNWSGVQQLVAGFSLHALIAVVLLGLAGLFSLTGLGVRIGYVQAKASLRLQAAGLARFAGPIGVVSSGSMVTVHRRPARRTAGAPRLVVCRDEVA